MHRKVCGLLASEDAIDVAGRLPVLIKNIRSIGPPAISAELGEHRKR